MAIEKGLIIKSLLGVSAVGGGVTVVAVGHKEGWLSNLGTDAGADVGTGQGDTNARAGQSAASGVGAGGGENGQPQTPVSATVTQSTDGVSQNKKFEELKIPDTCDFSEEDTTTTPKKCDVSKEALVKIAFKDKEENQDLTVDSAGDNFTGMKLEVKKLSDEEKNNYGNSIEYTFTFKEFDKTVTLKKRDTEVVKLVKDTNPEFKKTDDNKLERIWKEEGSFCQKVGFTCENGNNVTIKTSSEIPFLESGQIKKYKIKETSEITNKITVAKDSEGYNQGFKFSTTGDVEFKSSDDTEISGDDAKKLKASKDYQILFKDGENGGWYLVEKEKPAPAA